MLSRFICVWFSATPWTVAHQACLSMGFSTWDYWSGLPCPPPGDLPDLGVEPESLTSPALAGGFLTTSATWEAQWFSECSLCISAISITWPGSSVHGILQARLLEWVVMPFSKEPTRQTDSQALGKSAESLVLHVGAYSLFYKSSSARVPNLWEFAWWSEVELM